ncbi:MAG: hypothetical protein K1V84_02065 [Muribaculaceae bacterium]
MKKSFTYSLLAALLLGSASMSAESVKLLTFTLPAEADGLTRSFQISANDGQSIQVDWGDGELSAPVALADYDAAGWVFTEVSGTIKGTTVTVWGADPATINYIDLSWDKNASVDTKIKSVNLSRLTGVKEIAIDTNQLTNLDVSKNTSATSVKADNNQLESITLPETGAESVLKTLSVQNTINADGTLNGNNQLLAADFASAPNLTSLNLSYNTVLGWFDTFSIAENTKLTTLNITGCELDESNFDFSKFPALKTLNANFNKFKSIDLTGIAKKAYVYLNDNELTSVIPSEGIGRLQIKNNYFTFTNLPEVTLTGLNFAYAPQHDIPVGLGKGAKVDLASQLTAGDKATVYKWMQGETELEAGTAYTADNGVFTFKQPLNHAVCEMTNEKFPSLTLKSSEVTSPEFLEAIATFTVSYDPANELPVHIEAFSLLPEGTSLQVGAGDGSVSAPVIAPTSDSWDGAIFDVVPAGTVISLYGDDSLEKLLISCNSDRYPIDGADISKLTKLESLSISNNNLTTIDLSANKALKSLSLPSNKLGALTLDLPALTSLTLNNYATSGENRLEGSDFSKCQALESINLNYTGLTSFDLSKFPALRSAYMMGNEFASISLPASETLTYISLNANKLTALDASASAPKITIYANDNNIEEVKVPAAYEGDLSVRNNKLTFATMPKTTGDLTYAPQQDMVVAPADGKIDLSAQNDVDGKATIYTWTAGGATLAEGTDYVADNGVFTFLADFTDAACSMTNEALPDLTLATVPVAVTKSAIEAVEAAAVTVSAANGAIIIEGDFNVATIADMAGRTIAAKAVTPVAAGIYVVNVDGNAVKVAVK